MPRKAADKPATKKTSTRKKKTDVVAEAVAETTPIVETAASEVPVSPAPKKRGRKPKNADTAADAPVKKTRGRKKVVAPAVETAPVVEEPLPGQLAFDGDKVPAEVVDEAPAAPVAETPAVEVAPLAPEASDALEAPAKKARKPRAKKADNAPADETPRKRGRKSTKDTGPVLTTTLQLGDKEFDISGIAEKAYKEYKRVHKRKVVTDFHIYVKPEEGAAYFTINGEGSEDFKVEL